MGHIHEGCVLYLTQDGAVHLGGVEGAEICEQGDSLHISLEAIPVTSKTFMFLSLRPSMYLL